MCMGGNQNNNIMAQAIEQQAVDAARKKEEERQGRLTTGVTGINNAFSGFGDDFYNNYKKSYLDVYNPEVDNQYQKALEQLNYGHERAGTFASGAAVTNLADLNQQNDFNRANVALKADAAAGALRGTVGQQKQAVINQLYSTENPDIAANTALNSVRTIQDATPEYSPLGDIFKLAAVGGGNYLQAANSPYKTMGDPASVYGRNVNS